MKKLMILMLVLLTVPLWAGKEYDEAVNLIKEKKYGVAKTLLEAVLRQDDNTKVRYALGYCHEKLGNKDEAINHYQIAVAKNASGSEKSLSRLVMLRPEILPVLKAAADLDSASVKSDSERAYLSKAALMLRTYALNTKIEKKPEPEKVPVKPVVKDDPSKSIEKVLGYELKWHRSGAEKFNGHYYMFFKKEMTWKEAQERCKDMGGYLVTVNSEEEQKFLQELTGVKARYWMGAHNLTHKDWSQWITGEPIKYKKRAATQPDNASVCPGGQHWMYYREQGWDDEGISYQGRTLKKYYVCEWEK